MRHSEGDAAAVAETEVPPFGVAPETAGTEMHTVETAVEGRQRIGEEAERWRADGGQL